MEGIIFAIIFPLIFCTLQALINNKTKVEEPDATENQFCIKYPSVIGVIAIFDMVACMTITIVAIHSLDGNYWVVLIPFSFVIAGFYLFLKAFFWKIYVYDDVITLLRPFHRPYTFSLKEIISVKRECKDTYSGTAERMLIRTTKVRRICVESGASGYSLLKEKLCSQLNCRALWGF